jgi:hypothetical protein
LCTQQRQISAESAFCRNMQCRMLRSDLVAV